MTIQEIRILLKVHIQAADSIGKAEAAMALLEVLVAIDESGVCQRDSERVG